MSVSISVTAFRSLTSLPSRSWGLPVWCTLLANAGVESPVEVACLAAEVVKSILSVLCKLKKTCKYQLLRAMS